jgi:hypothetical protein
MCNKNYRSSHGVLRYFLPLTKKPVNRISRGAQVKNAEVAQSVEQWTENPRVPSSILGLGTTIYPNLEGLAKRVMPSFS